jgi:hypothetical protein
MNERESIQETAAGARYQWLTPVIPDTQEAEIRRIAFEANPGKPFIKKKKRKKRKEKETVGKAVHVAQW